MALSSAAAGQNGDVATRLNPRAEVHALIASVDAARGAGLAHDDLRQLRQRGAQSAPDPTGEHLAGRVLEALDLVEVVVVETVENRLHRGRTGRRSRAPNRRGRRPGRRCAPRPVRVPVQARALVAGRDVRQPMRGFERELLEDLHREDGRYRGATACRRQAIRRRSRGNAGRGRGGPCRAPRAGAARSSGAASARRSREHGDEEVVGIAAGSACAPRGRWRAARRSRGCVARVLMPSPTRPASSAILGPNAPTINGGSGSGWRNPGGRQRRRSVGDAHSTWSRRSASAQTG